MTLQGQLANRGLLMKAAAKLGNALPVQTDETSEKARLLPQNKSADYQASINWAMPKTF